MPKRVKAQVPLIPNSRNRPSIVVGNKRKARGQAKSLEKSEPKSASTSTTTAALDVQGQGTSSQGQGQPTVVPKGRGKGRTVPIKRKRQPKKTSLIQESTKGQRIDSDIDVREGPSKPTLKVPLNSRKGLKSRTGKTKMGNNLESQPVDPDQDELNTMPLAKAANKTVGSRRGRKSRTGRGRMGMGYHVVSVPEDPTEDPDVEPLKQETSKETAGTSSSNNHQESTSSATNSSPGSTHDFSDMAGFGVAIKGVSFSSPVVMSNSHVGPVSSTPIPTEGGGTNPTTEPNKNIPQPNVASSSTVTNPETSSVIADDIAELPKVIRGRTVQVIELDQEESNDPQVDPRSSPVDLNVTHVENNDNILIPHGQRQHVRARLSQFRYPNNSYAQRRYHHQSSPKSTHKKPNFDSLQVIGKMYEQLGALDERSTRFLSSILADPEINKAILSSLLKKRKFGKRIASQIAKSPGLDSLDVGDMIMSSIVKDTYREKSGQELPETIPQGFWKEVQRILQQCYLESAPPSITSGSRISGDFGNTTQPGTSSKGRKSPSGGDPILRRKLRMYHYFISSLLKAYPDNFQKFRVKEDPPPPIGAEAISAEILKIVAKVNATNLDEPGPSTEVLPTKEELYEHAVKCIEALDPERRAQLLAMTLEFDVDGDGP